MSVSSTYYGNHTHALRKIISSIIFLKELQMESGLNGFANVGTQLIFSRKFCFQGHDWSFVEIRQKLQEMDACNAFQMNISQGKEAFLTSWSKIISKVAINFLWFLPHIFRNID